MPITICSFRLLKSNSHGCTMPTIKKKGLYSVFVTRDYMYTTAIIILYTIVCMY